MAFDCAAAVSWTYQNIIKFKGDPGNISVMGHSAGGHLASLIALNDQYFENINVNNPLKKCILIDAFGLNIYKFLAEHKSWYQQMLFNVFTRDKNVWEAASPSKHISSKIPFLVFTGTSSYPFLIEDNDLFVSKLKEIKADVNYIKTKREKSYRDDRPA